MKGKITVVEVHTWGLYEVPRGWALYEIPGGTTLREIAHKAPILVLDWRPGTLASPSECRNPLRTGLGSARPKRPGAGTFPACCWSQSPENGSRLCKAGRSRCLVWILTMTSQSPENGSRLCKPGRRRSAGGGLRSGSQSPENGSRLCKAGAVTAPPPVQLLVAIP